MPFNVVVATPSTGQCKSAFAFSLARMVAYFASNRVLPEHEQQQMDFLLLEGSGINSNRERMVNEALAKEGMTHLLWIDDDMGFNLDTLHIMARRRQPIVSCNYRMRVPPGEFTALRMDRTARIETTREATGLEEAHYTGFGFCLMERRVLEAVKPPRFLCAYLPESRSYTTEDLPFFAAAREAGFNCWVDHDASKRVWHHGAINYVWSEDYSGMNRDFKPSEGNKP